MNIVEAFLEVVQFLGGIDFDVVFSLFGMGLVLFWLVIMGWAWSDAQERYGSKGVALMIVILLLTLNIFGLIIYIIIRPRYTKEEEYWEDLEKRFLKYEAQGIGDCPHCGYDVQPSFIYCPNCGKELRVKCKNCEMYLEPDWKVCPFCGTRQKAEKKEIKISQVTNIDTAPNKKVLQWGKKIDSFFSGLKKKVNKLDVKSGKNKKSKGKN